MAPPSGQAADCGGSIKETLHAKRQSCFLVSGFRFRSRCKPNCAGTGGRRSRRAVTGTRLLPGNNRPGAFGPATASSRTTGQSLSPNRNPRSVCYFAVSMRLETIDRIDCGMIVR